jgi:hypothetical protein
MSARHAAPDPERHNAIVPDLASRHRDSLLQYPEISPPALQVYVIRVEMASTSDHRAAGDSPPAANNRFPTQTAIDYSSRTIREPNLGPKRPAIATPIVSRAPGPALAVKS